MSWWSMAVVGALSGALGAMGLGGGGVLLVYLALAGVPQLAAQGVNLVFILPVGLVGLCLHRRHGLVAWRVALPMVLGGLAGVAAGTLLAGRLPAALLSRLFGGLVCLLALRELWGAKALFHREGLSLFPKATPPNSRPKP